MTDIFDFPTLPEMPFLEELAEDLEGSLRVIAYAGRANNKSFIRRRQRETQRKYGPYLSYLVSDIGLINITNAYMDFQQLLQGNPSPEEIVQRCEDCLADNLTPPEWDDEYQGAFAKFYAENDL